MRFARNTRGPRRWRRPGGESQGEGLARNLCGETAALFALSRWKPYQPAMVVA